MTAATLPKSFEPGPIEAKWSALWEQRRVGAGGRGRPSPNR